MKAVIELSCHSGGLSHKSVITCLLYTSKHHRPHASVSVDVTGCPGGEIRLLSQCGKQNPGCTHFYTRCVTKAKHNQKKICSVQSDMQPGLICAGLSFFFLSSRIDRDDHRWCWNLPGPSSRDLTHLPLILFPPSVPVSQPVNTQTLNAAQTVREEPQHASHTLHSPTVQPAWAQTIPWLQGEI